MSRTKDVHLFVEWSFVEPERRLTAETKRNPSWISPRDARNCEFGLNASPRTPEVCSVMIERGESGGESFAVEYINTLGLYPV